MSVVEKLARAIYDATDPLGGDPIATLIHVSDHLFWDGVQPDKEMTDLERQLSAVQEVCRSAARAALKALRDPTPEMVEAGQQCEAWGGDGGQIYRAMIDAALDGEG